MFTNQKQKNKKPECKKQNIWIQSLKLKNTILCKTDTIMIELLEEKQNQKGKVKNNKKVHCINSLLGCLNVLSHLRS